MGAKRRLSARQAGLIAALLSVVVTACGGEGTAAAPTTSTSADRCATRVPLLIELHGYSEHSSGHESAVQWEPFAEEHGFLVITPQAGGDPPHWDLDADVLTVERIIDDAVASRCVDADRVYVSGYSMGAMLISELVCRIPDKVAAVAPVAGVRLVEPCEPTRPVPALIMHGTADDTVLWEGGINRFAADALEMSTEGPSIIAIAAAWAARNGCEPDADVTVDGRITEHVYRCPDDAAVELHVIEEGVHGWPTGANDRIWAFFERHALD